MASQVLVNKPLDKILTDEAGEVTGFRVRSRGDGEAALEVWTADKYVSAMPVHVMKTKLPGAWAAQPFFANAFEHLRPVPVINVQLWFDAKLPTMDSLIFSRSKLLSVYADMSTTCREAARPDRSMLEFVFAPATKATGADRDWVAEPDEAIVHAVLSELEALFPDNFGPGAGAPVGLVKSSVVKTPASIYLMAAGMQAHRPSQVRAGKMRPIQIQLTQMYMFAFT